MMFGSLYFLITMLIFFAGPFSLATSAVSSAVSLVAPIPARGPVVAVQLFEWPWQDVARECEIYLGPTKFSAVLTSPPHEHISGAPNQWWQRYQVVSYKLSSRGGDQKSYADMITRCHKAGVKVYADAVINHMSGIDKGVGLGDSAFSHYEYPGLFSNDDFHHCGTPQDDIQDFKNLYQLQFCELVNLADLATEKKSVQKKIATYLNHLLDLGVDGLRIDAAKHIPSQDIASIRSLLKSPTYIFQELIISPGEPLQYNDYTKNGAVTAYGYPYFVATAFKKKKLQELNKISTRLPPSSDAVVFLNNHDLERAQNQDTLLNAEADPILFSLAQTFMMTWPYGYPHIFSGYHFKNRDEGPPVDSELRTRTVLDSKGQCLPPWSCVHRDPKLAALIHFREQIGNSTPVLNYWTGNGSRSKKSFKNINENQIAFSRGKQGFVVINFSEQDLTRTFNTSLPPGAYCNELAESKACSSIVDSNNNLTITVPMMSAVLLLKQIPIGPL